MLSTKNRSPFYSMGQRLISESTYTLSPGPAAYGSSDNLRKHSPSVGFGSSKRPPLNSKGLDTPGPGSYYLPTKIQQVPEYALPKRPDQSKYV